MDKVKKWLLILIPVMLCIILLLSVDVAAMVGILKVRDAKGKPVAVKIKSDEATSSYENALTAVVTVTEAPIGIQVQDSFNRADTTSGWGNADIGGTWLHKYGDGSDASNAATISNYKGKMTISTGRTGVNVISYVGSSTIGDYDLLVMAQSDRTADSRMMIVGRVTDYNNFYAAELNLGANTFKIRENRGGYWTDLGGVDTPTLEANTPYMIRFQLQGTTLKAKWWKASDVEPVWAIEVTDSTFTSGQVGVRAFLTAARSTANLLFDDFLAKDVW